MPSCTTPAEAGAQLEDAANEGRRFVTATLPIGPRPSPEWCYSPGMVLLTQGGATAEVVPLA
jgi:hypothetical protein